MYQNNYLQNHKYKTIRGFQLALDQSPRAGKKRSYKLEELFQLERLTAEMHVEGKLLQPKLS